MRATLRYVQQENGNRVLAVVLSCTSHIEADLLSMAMTKELEWRFAGPTGRQKDAYEFVAEEVLVKEPISAETPDRG